MDYKDKRGVILVENIIFIVLNFIFLTIMILFIYNQAGGLVLMEESYAKNIALIIDSAKPGMEIYLDMERPIKEAEDEKWPIESIIDISDNIVTIKLTKDSAYSYAFFNDVDVTVTFDQVGKKGFYFYIEGYSEKEAAVEAGTDTG